MLFPGCLREERSHQREAFSSSFVSVPKHWVPVTHVGALEGWSPVIMSGSNLTLIVLKKKKKHEQQ